MVRRRPITLFGLAAEVSHAMQPPLVGSDAIAGHYCSSRVFRVVQYRLQADSTHVQGDGSVQRGSFLQESVTAAGETVSVAGTFEAQWRRGPERVWLLHRLHTEPKATDKAI